jgi:hypothetical protein
MMHNAYINQKLNRSSKWFTLLTRLGEVFAIPSLPNQFPFIFVEVFVCEVERVRIVGKKRDDGYSKWQPLLVSA